jgi:hypothetical protein
MSQDDVKPSRSWQELAQATAKEEDPFKVLELAQELIRALDAASDRRMQQIGADDKSREQGAA